MIDQHSYPDIIYPSLLILQGSNNSCFTAVKVGLGLLELDAVLYGGESSSHQHIIE